MKELPRVDGDLDEDVEDGDGGAVYGDEAAVAEMHEEVRVERARREVVDAAGPVGDVAEDEAVRDGGECGEDVGDDEGVHEEAFGELKRHARRVGGTRPPDDLVDLEVVVGREKGDGGVQRGVVEDGVGDLVLHEALRPRSGRRRRLMLLYEEVGWGFVGCFRHSRGRRPRMLTALLCENTFRRVFIVLRSCYIWTWTLVLGLTPFFFFLIGMGLTLLGHSDPSPFKFPRIQ